MTRESKCMLNGVIDICDIHLTVFNVNRDITIIIIIFVTTIMIMIINMIMINIIMEPKWI